MCKRTLFCLIFTLLILFSGNICQTADSGTINFTSSQSNSLNINRQNACEGLNITVGSYSDKELTDGRAQHNNLFNGKTALAIEIFQDQEYLKLLDKDLIIFLVTFILIVLVFISSVIYFINICLCCCTGKSETNQCCINCNLFMMGFGLVGFIAYCIALAFYIQNIRAGLKEVACTLQILPDDIINGYSTSPAFMGFFPLYEFLVKFKIDFDMLANNNYNTYANSIDNLNLRNDSLNMLNSLDSFCIDCKENTTSNAEGLMKVPFSVSTNLDTTITSAQAEFTQIYQYCNRIETGIESLKTLLEDPNQEELTKGLDSLIEKTNNFSVQINDLFESFNKYFTTVNDVSKISHIVFLVFCFVCALFGFTLFIILCYAVKNRHSSNFCCWRFSIAILGFFSLIFMVYSFSVSVVSFTTSASCGLLENIHTSSGVNRITELFSLDTQTNTLLQKCLVDSEDGEINTLLHSSQESTENIEKFDHISNFISVVEDYDKDSLNISSDKSSKSFTSYKDTLDGHSSGDTEDHFNIHSTQSLLNEIVSCAKEYYILNTDSCPSSYTCKVLANTSEYVAPSCQIDETKNLQASTYVQNLNKYITQTISLTTTILNKSYSFDSDPKTPNKLYYDLVTEIDTMMFPMNKLKENLTSIGLKDKNLSLKDNLNCKSIKDQFNTIENYMCFDFSPNLYTFMIISLIASGFFFIFVWNLCCTICCIERSILYNEESKIKYAKNNSDFHSNTKMEKYEN
jgi:hypothetical protein